MDYLQAKRILKTELVTSFAKTKFRNAELRKKALEWATSLPSGRDYAHQIETVYHRTYKGCEIRFGKPGKETKRERLRNILDMTPILYQKIDGKLVRSIRGYSFQEMLQEVQTKINKIEEAGHILLALLYRCGVLDDHSFTKGRFSYRPDHEIMGWLDSQFEDIGETLPSEFIPLYDAIMLNEDVKLYTNPERYQSAYMKPYEARGRVNTLGAIFVVCAPEAVLSRIDACSLLIRGRGTPAIFSATHDFGRDVISTMTGGIVDYHEKQISLL